MRDTWRCRQIYFVSAPVEYSDLVAQGVEAAHDKGASLAGATENKNAHGTC
jgi:hypothetical protein